jgi:hypothetical protein
MPLNYPFYTCVKPLVIPIVVMTGDKYEQK